MSRLSQKKALQIIGGPLLIDWALYRLAIPFVILGSVLINANLLTPNQAPQVVLIAFVSTAAMFAWAYLFDKTFFRNRDQHPVAMTWVVIFGLCLGITKGLSSELMLVWFGIEQLSIVSALQRSLPVGLAGLIIVLVTPLIESNRIEYQSRRDTLVRSLVQDELETGQNYLDDSDLEEISKGIKNVRSSTSSDEASEKLQKLVTQVIRPQSHKLWKKQNSRFPNYSSRELLAHGLMNQPFNPMQSSFLTAIGIFVFNVFREPFASALARTAIVWVIVFTLYAIASQIKVTTVSSGVWLFGLVVLLSSLIGTYMSIAVIGEPFFELVIITFLVYLSWQLLNTLVVAGVRTSFESSKSVEEELKKLNLGDSLDSSVREVIDRLNSREVANHLHSTVQNQVLAASLRIQNQNLSQQEISSELDLLESLFESSFALDEKAEQAGIEKELEKIKSRWQGFIEIEYSVESSIPVKQTKRIQQILNEAISNAVRHGHAETIQIAISRTDQSTFVSVIDDGFGPRGGKPGLGTSLFETSSMGKWKFEAIDGGGSKLVVLL